MKRLYLCLMFLLLFSPFNLSIAEVPSLWVGNMNISIGMAKSEVLSTLRKNHEVILNDKADDSGWERYSIYKKAKERKAEGLIGGISFTKDKVEWVSKNWGFFNGQEVASFGEEFIGALSKLTVKSDSRHKDVLSVGDVTVQINETRQPGVSIKSIYFIAGKHHVAIIITQDGISMQEDIKK